MKKIIIGSLSIIALWMYSCQDNTSYIETNSVNFQYPAQPSNIPVYSTTELIIQYNGTATSFQKDSIRQNYQILRYEICNHCDGTIEKWNFGPGVDLENKLGSIKSGSGGAESVILRVEKEFEFGYEYEETMLSGGSGNMEYDSKITAINNGVTIAVLDSGIDVHYPVFETTPFLYNASGSEASEISSGWDYVDEDSNCYDQYSLVHGTAVTYIIHTTLSNLAIPHQIIPVRVADEFGKVSKFNLICGMSFARTKADLIQISLGWYDIDGPDDTTNDIFLNLLETTENNTLVITSAGNSNNNNDLDTEEDFPHYPSNYETLNMVSVAAANEAITEIASFSNYGNSSVDFISRGTLIPFMTAAEIEVPISGTSFSAPYVSAIAAKLLYESGMLFTPEQIIEALEEYGSSFTTFEKPTKFDKLIVPE